MSADVAIGWEVQFWDYMADYADWAEDTVWQEQSNAERRCRELIAQEIENRNERQRAVYDVAMQAYRESVALVEAGLRKTARPEPVEPAPITELGTELYRVVPHLVTFEDADS